MQHVDAWFCCTLADRPEKWEAFKERCPIDGVIRVDGLDTRAGGHPSWWRVGGAAWGCYQTHLAILKEALARNMECVGVFEDDAVFRQGFWPMLRRLLDETPDDWGQLYLGGQHLTQPKESTGYPDLVSPRVHRVKNVNRCHAYLIRQPFLSQMVEHLEDTTSWTRAFRKGQRPHIDHWMGQLHDRVDCVYASRPWLVGQSEGRSTISAEDLGERWWPLREQTYAPVSGQTIGVCRGFPQRPHYLERVEEMLKLGGFAVRRLPSVQEWSHARRFISSLEQCDAVVVWNGHEGLSPYMKEVSIQRGVPVVVVENGFLPQRGHVIFDRTGIAGYSDLCGPLDWVSEASIGKGRLLVEEFRRSCGVERTKSSRPICVCPLQNWWDSTVLFSSNFKSMEEFLWKARSLTNLDIVVCPHPKFRAQAKNLKLPPRTTIAPAGGSTLEWFAKASRVIGVNSTSLYEAVALGVPTTALGACPLRYHQDDESRRRLFGAIAERQVAYDAPATEAMASCGVRLRTSGGVHSVDGIRS